MRTMCAVRQTVSPHKTRAFVGVPPGSLLYLSFLFLTLPHIHCFMASGFASSDLFTDTGCPEHLHPWQSEKACLRATTWLLALKGVAGWQELQMRTPGVQNGAKQWVLRSCWSGGEQEGAEGPRMSGLGRGNFLWISPPLPLPGHRYLKGSEMGEAKNMIYV